MASCTALMCVEVTAIVPPRQQALLRTAGSVGAAAYTEVVAQGRSTMHLEYTAPEGEECGPHVPVVLPFTTTEDDPFDNGMAVLVVSHSFLAHTTRDADLNQLPVHRSGIRHLRYVVGDGVTSIGAASTIVAGTDLWYCKLQSVELVGCEHLTTIRDVFLFMCTSLTSIDLSPLCNVTSIGHGFMSECNALRTINLTPLCNVTSIGRNFMIECSSLTSIDISPLLSKLTTIDESFLSGCCALTDITLSPPPPTSPSSLSEEATRSAITHVGDNFLRGCRSLTAFDLGSLSGVPLLTVGSSFMCGCEALTFIDLGPLHCLTTVPHGFLHRCKSIKSINLSPLNNVTEVGGFCLAMCPSLTHIDLQPFENVAHVGTHFLAGCIGLTTIDVSPLRNATSIGADFVTYCDDSLVVEQGPPDDGDATGGPLAAALTARLLPTAVIHQGGDGGSARRIGRRGRGGPDSLKAACIFTTIIALIGMGVSTYMEDLDHVASVLQTIAVLGFIFGVFVIPIGAVCCVGQKGWCMRATPTK